MSVSTEVQRTLVKSPPELWAELSDAESLARHLGEPGQIRITRAEPERELTWEADGASGNVRLSPSGFGTKVTLSLTRALAEPEAAEPQPTPEPVAGEPVAEEPEPQPPDQRRGFFVRLFRRRRMEQAIATEAAKPESEPELVVAVEPETGPESELEAPIADVARDLAAVEAQMAEQDAELLKTLLDRLGAAHHRPFSRG
jgi:hypothetical protein